MNDVGDKASFGYSKRLALFAALAMALTLPAGTNGWTATTRAKPRDANPWVTPAVKATGLEQKIIRSAAARSRVSFHIYTPPGYAKNDKRRYPSLYWLHGTGGGLGGLGTLVRHFDAAIQAGKIPPMIVVFPNGLPEGMWTDSADRRYPVETVVVQEILPYVDSQYRTVKSAQARIIEGFSMGGYGAGRIGFRHPDLFASISMLAAGPLDLDFAGPQTKLEPELRHRILATTYGGNIEIYRAQSPWRLSSARAGNPGNLGPFRQIFGSADFTADDNRRFHEHLTNQQVSHFFVELPDVKHDVREIFSVMGEDNWKFYCTAFVHFAGESCKE